MADMSGVNPLPQAGFGLQPFLDPISQGRADRPGQQGAEAKAGGADKPAGAPSGAAADGVTIAGETAGPTGIRPVGDGARGEGRRRSKEEGAGYEPPPGSFPIIRSKESTYNEALGTFQTTIRIGDREIHIPPEQLAKFRESYERFVNEHFGNPPLLGTEVLGGQVDEEG